MSPLIFAFLLVGGGYAFPGSFEGSGDYDVLDIAKPVNRVPPDEEILDPIEVVDGLYPEDDDDYHGSDDGGTTGIPRATLNELLRVGDSDQGLTTEGDSTEGPVRFDFLEDFDVSESKPKTVNTAAGVFQVELDSRNMPVEEMPPNCSGHKKLSAQPRFVNSSINLIRKCCPQGESLQLGDKNQAALCKASAPWNQSQVQVINAQFYDGCIEDLEEQAPPLGMVYGSPCALEGGLIRFSEDANDTLFVIQNGSLLVIYDQVDAFDVYGSYCLDSNPTSGAMNAYVCPSEVRMGSDIFKGQMVALALCLIFAIPLLLATAYFYVAIPQFNDIHGKALSLNCINFAVALLLESVFQHKSKGNGSTDDTIVLANYAEYFILATFFWLLVNCMNNCIHAWYFLPRGLHIHMHGEKRTFALYAAFAQLVPLAIILLNPPNGDLTALKHYFFIPIIVIIVLNMLSFIITFWGFQRVNDILIQHYILRGRLSTGGEAADAVLAKLPNIQTADVERVKYMTKYTAMLFVVMSGVWSITIATYYSTRVIPILYDILFGLQGILIFIIFICLPRPFRTVKLWFQKKGYCGCQEDPDGVNLRRDDTSYRARNGNKEGVPLNNVVQS